ncbi:hypothetical protein WKW77_25105 [Variovorax ureilyticus]|uniref:Uncharacterized protein n=1 Tax=Variovorax ureilyticus TaxID=1836198 RepID=A0ABU8VMJ6_9BURK
MAYRVTGVILATGIPFCHASFARQRAVVRTPDANCEQRFVAFVCALFNRLLAGVRHLLMGIGIGSDLADARRSAWLTDLGGVSPALMAAGVVL